MQGTEVPQRVHVRLPAPGAPGMTDKRLGERGPGDVVRLDICPACGFANRHGAKCPERALPAEYVAQVRDMAQAIAEWHSRQDPGQEAASVRFPHPDTHAAMTVDQAIATGFIVANGAGRRLLEHVTSRYPPQLAPTPLMLQVALQESKAVPK